MPSQRLALTVLALTVSAGIVGAQPPSTAAGEPALVRVWASEPRLRKARAMLLSENQQGIWIRRVEKSSVSGRNMLATDSSFVRAEALDRLDVSVRRSRGRGALVGSGKGVLGGMAAGLVLGGIACAADQGGYGCILLGIGPVMLAPVGFGIGGVLGAFMPGNRWERVR